MRFVSGPLPFYPPAFKEGNTRPDTQASYKHFRYVVLCSSGLLEEKKTNVKFEVFSENLNTKLLTIYNKLDGIIKLVTRLF
jgi:hypothetical protein